MVTKSRTAPRDSAATRRRILDAVGRIIVGDGLAAVGVNAVARAAACDKVLIYRYFGDLAGLHKAFAEQSDFWWSLDELTHGLDPAAVGLAEALKTVLRRHAAALRRRPATLAVLAAEMVERTPLVAALEAIRERRALELNAWIASRFAWPEGIDWPAMASIIGAAFNYLAARGRSTAVMGGVGVASEADWERLFAAADALIDAALRRPG